MTQHTNRPQAEPQTDPAPWWILIERDTALPDGYPGEPLPPLVLGPFAKARVHQELESDSGTVYLLCTDEAKRGGYIVDDVHALPRRTAPAGERTPLYEWT